MHGKQEQHSLFLFLELLTLRRGMIVGITLTATLLALVTALLLPAWYEARALLLPSKIDTMPVGKYNQLSQIASLTSGLELPALVTPADIYVRILKSRTISDRIIDSFSLQQRYTAKTREETYEALADHARFLVTDEGLISIAVEDREPVVAAQIANAYVDELNTLARELVTSKTREKREFIELRLREVRRQLDSARSALELFQVSRKAIDFDEQTKLAIDLAVGLKTELAKLEIDIQLTEQFLGADNQELLDKRKRRNLIRQRLAQLEAGSSDSSFFSLPLAAIPGLRGQYEYLIGVVRVNEGLHEVLQEQLEQAKIQEQESAPNVSIVDPAVVPELRKRPVRSAIVAFTAIGSLLLAIGLAAIMQGLRRLEEESGDDFRRVSRFIQAFFGWIPGVGQSARPREH